MRRVLPLSALATVLGLASSPMTAQTPMTGTEFEAYASGRTLTFATGGQIYGAEQYLSGRRVLWAFTGDQCQEGVWYEQAGQICFVYDYDPTPQCWTFWSGEGGLSARFEGDLPGTELSEVAQTSDPLLCAGPEVGV